ncbi:MAG: UDP-N-acetylglucosamine--N-acetylmuramyl-(pentapeptide) pyrophosphoryl-undecaprenol N-acetylglucosamine transferase [Candidatus Peregrinibacteria bacterium]
MSHSVLFVGGGSIGHIAPSIAVAHALRDLRPDCTIHFVCSTHEGEAAFIQKEGFRASPTAAPKLSLLFPLRFFRALRQAGALLKQHKPAVIFSKGGYVSLPLCIVAWWHRVPVVLHESDAVGGRANRIVSLFAHNICWGMNVRVPRPFRQRSTFTGNPIRPGINEGGREEGLRITGFSGERPVLLVMGGSQGAEVLNQFVVRHFADLSAVFDVIHLTGPGKTGLETGRHYWKTEFAYGEMPHLFAAATVAVSRAGANCITELAANSVPSILIPLRGVGHDHQYQNALVAARSGGCICVEQSALEQQLLPALQNLASSPETQTRMRLAMRSLHEPAAAGQIAKILSRHLA